MGWELWRGVPRAEAAETCPNGLRGSAYTKPWAAHCSTSARASLPNRPDERLMSGKFANVLWVGWISSRRAGDGRTDVGQNGLLVRPIARMVSSHAASLCGQLYVWRTPRGVAG